MPSSIALVAVLGAVAIRVLLLVALAALVAWTLRRASAAARHVLWSTVLLGTLVIAAAGPLRPSWSLPFGAALPVPVFGALAPVHEGKSLALEGALPLATRAPGARPLPAARLAGIALLAWLSGVAILVLRLVVGVVSLRRLAGRGHAQESGRARALLAAISGRAVRRASLIETDELETPATWGVLRPVIALPAAASTWSTWNLETALRHEVAHVLRRDVLTQLLADGCCALLWFHPAVWYAAGRMRAERERACDDAVLAGGSADVDYADMLVAVAAGAQRSLSTAVEMAHASGLEARIRAILDPALRRRDSLRVLSSVAAGALVAAAALAGLEVFGVTPEEGGADLVFGERVPLAPEREQWALRRHFEPRDARERQALERLQEAARHVKQHEMDFIHERAVWALAIAREDEVLGPLARQLESHDWRVRAYAAWCLDLVGAEQAREQLRARLGDPIWRVRAAAATALVDLGEAPTADEILPLLEDPAWQVRAPAVQLLARTGAPEATAAIRARLNDPHVAVRNAARTALDGFSTP